MISPEKVKTAPPYRPNDCILTTVTRTLGINPTAPTAKLTTRRTRNSTIVAKDSISDAPFLKNLFLYSFYHSGKAALRNNILKFTRSICKIFLLKKRFIFCGMDKE